MTRSKLRRIALRPTMQFSYTFLLPNMGCGASKKEGMSKGRQFLPLSLLMSGNGQ